MSIPVMIIKAMAIGVLGSIPVGPIVILTFQRSLTHGRKAGMACALGAILSDTVFAALALFAFSVISNLLKTCSNYIEIAGGLIIIAVGIGMLLKKGSRIAEQMTKSSVVYDTGKSMLIGFTNPGSFLWILAAFAASGFDATQMTVLQSALIVGSVFAGSFIYWYFFTLLVSKGKDRLKLDTLLKINRISAVAIILFGIFFLCRGLLG